MLTLSQNKKIAIAAVAVFIVSFSGVMFVLSGGSGEVATNVLESGGGDEHGEAVVEDKASLEKEYRELLGDEENAIFVTDSEGHFEFVESQFCRMLQTNCDELADGKTIFELINSEDLPDFAGMHSKIIKEREKMQGVGPYRMLKKDHEILVILNMVPVLDEEDNVVKLVYSAKDITDQAQSLQEKEQVEEAGGGSILKYLYPRVESMKGEAGKVVYKE
ncbi:MAG: PAS domain-containing protein [Candidatus Gracilibacteria bacterium]